MIYVKGYRTPMRKGQGDTNLSFQLNNPESPTQRQMVKGRDCIASAGMGTPI